MMEDNVYQFEKLRAWQSSKELTGKVYQLLNKFPKVEQYALCDQIRRAIISVPSNIAEGSGRMSYKEKIHFLEIAYGSLLEVYCQLQVAVDLGYITTEDLQSVKLLFFTTSSLISGLRRSFEGKI